MSGIRYINNIFKHSRQAFEVSYISQAGFHLECKEDDKKGINITDVKLVPALLFGDLDQVSTTHNIKNKRKKHNLKTKGQLHIRD